MWGKSLYYIKHSFSIGSSSASSSVLGVTGSLLHRQFLQEQSCPEDRSSWKVCVRLLRISMSLRGIRDMYNTLLL